MTNSRKLLADLFTALAVAIVAVVLVHSSASSSKQTSAEKPFVQLAQSMLLQDRQASLEGQNALTQKPTAMKNFGISLAIDAPQMAADYGANEVAADEKYKGGKILVSGRVNSISKDFAGAPYVALTGDQVFHDVQARFGDDDVRTLASLKKGQEVYLVCEAKGLVVTEVMLDSCVTVEDYTVHARQSLDEYVEDAVAGRKQPDEATGAVLRMAKVVAPLLPGQSSCFTRVDDACEAQIQAVLKTLDDDKRHEVQQKLKASGASPK